jgi:hypothetical protein
MTSDLVTDCVGDIDCAKLAAGGDEDPTEPDVPDVARPFGNKVERGIDRHLHESLTVGELDRGEEVVIFHSRLPVKKISVGMKDEEFASVDPGGQRHGQYRYRCDRPGEHLVFVDCEDHPVGEVYVWVVPDDR